MQYALKYWLGMALTIMGITLILWLGEGSGASAPANASNLNNFFFTWQPGEERIESRVQECKSYFLR